MVGGCIRGGGLLRGSSLQAHRNRLHRASSTKPISLLPHSYTHRGNNRIDPRQTPSDRYLISYLQDQSTQPQSGACAAKLAWSIDRSHPSRVTCHIWHPTPKSYCLRSKRSRSSMEKRRLGVGRHPWIN